jgi:hypothetical protein
MATTGTNIQDIAELYTGTTISDANAVLIINMAFNELATLGLSIKKEELTDVVANTAETLTAGTYGVMLVLDSDDNEYKLWEYDDGDITLKAAGDYTVISFFHSPDIAAVANSIGLDDKYRACLVKYLSGFVKLTNNDTSPDGHKLMQEFVQLATQTYNSILKSNLPGKVR